MNKLFGNSCWVMNQTKCIDNLTGDACYWSPPPLPIGNGQILHYLVWWLILYGCSHEFCFESMNVVIMTVAVWVAVCGRWWSKRETYPNLIWRNLSNHKIFNSFQSVKNQQANNPISLKHRPMFLDNPLGFLCRWLYWTPARDKNLYWKNPLSRR